MKEPVLSLSSGRIKVHDLGFREQERWVVNTLLTKSNVNAEVIYFGRLLDALDYAHRMNDLVHSLFPESKDE